MSDIDFLIGDKKNLLSIDKNELSTKKLSKLNCPEPKVKLLDNNTLFIFLNSTWFMDREMHFESFNKKCLCLNEIHLMEQLEKILEDYHDYHKIIVTHHGINSISELKGRGLIWNNWIPLYGQLYNAYRKHNGNTTDLTSSNYKNYRELLSKLLSYHDNITFISGHDYINSYFTNSSINHINVNTGTHKNCRLA